MRERRAESIERPVAGKGDEPLRAVPAAAPENFGSAPDVPDEGAIERFVPDGQASLMAVEHLARYHWAANLVTGCRVLDAASGAGYGSKLLASSGASSVVGVDLVSAVLPDGHAGRLRQVQGDLNRLPFADGAFDRVVCFEAIEHVVDAESVLDELQRVMSPDGVLVISSPDRDLNVPGNPFHVHEFTSDELRSTLEKRFVQVRMFGQHPFVSSRLGECQNGSAAPAPGPATLEGDRLLSLAPLVAAGTQYVIAVAGNGPLPSAPGLTMLGDPMDLRWWTEQLSGADRRVAALAAEARFLAEEVRSLGSRLVAAEQANANLLPQAEEIQELAHQLSEAHRRLAELADADRRLAETSDQLSQVQRELDALHRTKIMRIAAPARRVYGRVRRLAGRS